MFMRPCIVTNFFLIKPTDALISQIYFCQETLHVSGSFSAHHQEFSTVHSARVYVMLVLHLEHFISTYAQLKSHIRFLFIYIRVSSVPPHKEQATNTFLRQFQTNDIWNYLHSHSQFDIFNLNIHLEIHHWQKPDQLPLYTFNIV